MSPLRKLVTVEAKLFVREPVGAFFALAFPTVLMLVLGNAIPAFTTPIPELGGARPIDIYMPVTVAMAIATVTMITLMATLTAYREKGVLRRLSTTPVTPVALLSAQLVVNLAALVIGVALAYAGASIAFGISAPRNVAALLIAFVLGAVVMCSVALLIAALAPSARASSGIGTLVYFPLLFAAGVWTPGPMMPHSVQRVADLTPLGAASQALQAAWAGSWPRPLHLAVMAGFAAALGTLAAKLFRWS
jgi:ABC-2 type transport system permease protein